jgi:hypothetical protein
MTACTQPGCTGTIVDGYCDVCGSPAGAVPFVLIGGFPPKPKNAGLETACTQPGCTGMIVDCYCDVCGSPAGAMPFVPAMAAASALDEEAPTQPLSRLRMPAQQLSQEPADLVTADPAAVDTKKVGWEKELTENEIDVAQDYRTRVDEAQLPDDVREAVLHEVAKLERTGDQVPESDDIRNWLDTMLDLPWSTEISDSIDIEGSRDVEATLRGLIKPAVADVEEGDTAEVEPVVADEEEGDSAEVEPVVADEEEGDPAEVEPVTTDLEEGDTAKVDPAEVDTVNIDREKKELAGNETAGSKDLNTRVEEAQLPDEVRLAALREVGMLERTSDQSPESDDIRNGLDTVLDLPWSTEIMDSIDIEESRDVEARLRGLIKPAVVNEEGDPAEVEPPVADLEEGDPSEVGPLVADVEEGDPSEVGPLVADVDQVDTGDVEPLVADLEEGVPSEVGPLVADVEQIDPAEAEPAVADVEQVDPAEVGPAVADVEQVDPAEVGPLVADVERVDRAPAGPHDDDTVQMPAVLAGFSGREHSSPQLPEQQVAGPALVETPTKKRRVRSLALAATALAALLIGALVFGASRDGGVPAQSAPTVAATATATVSKPTSEPSDKSTPTGAASAIQVQEVSEPASASQTVRIKGRFRGGPNTFLRVQYLEGGKWLDYPLITKTSKSGRFTAYVEPGGPGRYQLRVLDPNSLVTSETFVLVIKG